jgi:hypothetical protein
MIDDFAWSDRTCQRPARPFPTMWEGCIQPDLGLFLRGDMAKSVTIPT